MLQIKFLKKQFWIPLGCVVLLASCKKDWDKHNEVTTEALNITVMEAVKTNGDLTKFASLLEKSGYDSLLNASKTLTVWAPSNTALQALDPAIENDAEKLKMFVANHIATQQFITYQHALEGKYVVMLNGKSHYIVNKSIEDATITEADKVVKNGVLQKIDKMLPALQNIWEVIETTSLAPKHTAYLLSLNYQRFDSTQATQIGVDPVTGQPVYEPGTGLFPGNTFWDRVYDLRREDRRFTVFLMEDGVYETEVTKLLPYSKANTADSTRMFAEWQHAKDLAKDTLLEYNTLPDTVLSRFLVKVPVEKAFVKHTIKTSNGIIYVMGKLEVPLANRIMQRRIEGESPIGYSHDRSANIFIRNRKNPVTNENFTDFQALGHSTAYFTAFYRVQNVFSGKYRAYWVAVNDFQSAAFAQQLGYMQNATTAVYLTAANVANVSYDEVYLGEITVPAFTPSFQLMLRSANSTNNTANPLVCDYIRLEPVF